MRRLALFLGSPNATDNSADGPGEYRTARYAFRSSDDEAFVSSETEFFGEALVEYMRHRGAPPGQLLIMGTNASIWDALFRLFPDDEIDDETYMEVWDAVQNRAATSRHLDAVEKFVNQRTDVSVTCRLVGTGATRNEQLDILSALAEFTDPGDELTIDITHGLRSMGLTAAAAGNLLTQTRQLEVADIFYGNFSIKTDGGHATVDRISARDELNEWADAISHFRRTGLLGDIPALVGRYDAGAESALRRLDHALVTNQFGGIQRWLHQAISNLKQTEPTENTEDSPATPFDLFRRDLLTALSGLQRDRLADLQLELADRALRHDDYLRAAICTFEAVVSAAAPSEEARTDGRKRHFVGQLLKKPTVKRKLTGRQRDALGDLRDLRNAVSHGTEPGGNESVRQLLQSTDKTRAFLNSTVQIARDIIEHIRDDDDIAQKARQFLGD